MVATTCKYCGSPVKQTPGRRKREFCDDVCRQRHHRAKQKPHEQEVTPDDGAMLLQAENAELKSTLQELLQFLNRLGEVKQMMRVDVQRRNFKQWLQTQGVAYAKTPWGQRLLSDKDIPLRAARLTVNASREGYAASMRASGRYSTDEMQEFAEAWEAMLWYELFKVEYVTIRDMAERAREGNGKASI